MNILSIQSWVATGHVGNAASVFPLQRLGVDVWAVHTVQFSNHPGHGAWTGRVATGAEIADIVSGIERRGLFPHCDAVLSGYMGDASIADAVLDAAHRVRRANPAALYCCDPVIGDGGRVYVREPIPRLIADAFVPAADILTPNQFELELLSGIACTDHDAVRRAIAALRARMRPDGPRAVLLTSLAGGDTPPGMLDVIAADAGGMHAARVAQLDVAASGAGDMTAALFLFHFLRTRRAEPAMAACVAAVQGVLRRTAAAASRDLKLIEAQDELVAPSTTIVTEVF